MRTKNIIYFTLLFTSNTLFNQVCAQTKNAQIDLHVMDNDSISLRNAQIEFSPQLKYQTNTEGKLSVNLPLGYYQLKILSDTTEEYIQNLVINGDKKLPIVLQSKLINLEEAVFTAKEDKGLTSKSVINRQALMHLQPSSFSDLMELLPGGLSTDPYLIGTNVVALRENSGRPSNYSTSSLGVQFMVDDNIINSNSDFQKSLDSSLLLSAPEGRNTYQTGVDMRSVSTNDIEKVEIIRGIPNASYGDLTSGLIKIERKIGNTPLQARLKVDGFSKQYYIGKGFRIKDNWSINSSFDILNAKVDPSDEISNYQRITASVRSKADFKIGENKLQWRTNLDFTGTLDQTKIDPDTGYDLVDKYRSYNRKIALANNFIFDLKKESFFNKIILNTAIQQGFNRIEQTKFVQYTGPRAISISTQAGENTGIYPELSFISDSYTDGKPLDLQTKLELKGNKKIGQLKLEYDLGTDWRFSKNYGDGDVYDITQPPTTSINTRPRAFKDIPGTQNLSVYGGNLLNYKINQHQFNLYTGYRLSTLLGVDSSYKIANKIFVEPRVNFQYSLPKINIGKNHLNIDVTTGYGEFYKQPTNLNLYPADQFRDYAQITYYHNDPQYRYINYMTYVTSLINKDLTAAKNIKKEVRIDFEYNKHQLSVTYYKENMKNGFRNVGYYNIHTYKKYDITAIDTNNWGPNGPDLSNVPYQDIKTFSSYTLTENGSATIKSGFEFQYNSPRIKAINTRFTLSGAWFKTKYYNTVPVRAIPSVSVGGNSGGFPYVGIYANDEGYKNSQLNYNLMIDTYIPSLDLTFSASLQGTLFTNNYRMGKIANPFAYMDLQGNIHPFLEEDKSDLYKQWLVRNTSATDYMSQKTSYNINMNLKVTKSIYKSIRASMFVNRLFNYNNPYTFNGVKVNPRNGMSPYFGMEINYNF
ncbi:Plug domain-containing protein [Empedobacter falsenii]